MLTLTENAVKAIKSMTADARTPDEGGLRIATRSLMDTSLEMELADSPGRKDQVVEAEGTRVFLEPMAARILEDRTLDADVTQAGDVSFRIIRQRA
ncbi:Fe-S cluster assembly protein HesB [Nonomuraea sp. SYSU D8015]|uniref:Fe-S cluster assembly protein HesB n=1 Tax=Nonomuraea sp. SYSU D8015 TaxID=2593644 RepID=UPI001660DA15|nr:Fe-S cluster assembly protein HesB [Nonomuraea sp. SYSU D8015]